MPYLIINSANALELIHYLGRSTIPAGTTYADVPEEFYDKYTPVLLAKAKYYPGAVEEVGHCCMAKHLKKIALTLNQALFHLEKGEYIVYFLNSGDGFIQKIDDFNYQVVAHPKYNNGCYLCGDIKNIQGVIKNLANLNAKMVVYPGCILEFIPYSGLQRIKSMVMGFFFRNPNVVQEIIGEEYQGPE
jgi:hypothetical protein